jgi:WD40 repeat protein
MTFGPQGAVASANYSPDGTRIVTGSWDNSARIWDAVGGKVLAKLEGGHTVAINTCVFSPDPAGRFVLTASDDGTAKMWEVVTQKQKESADGKIAEISVGRVVRTFAGHTARVGFAAFSPDGRWVLTASDDKTAAIWEALPSDPMQAVQDQAEPICVLSGHAWGVLSIAMSADGSQLITGSADKTARIWKLQRDMTGRWQASPSLLLEGHTAAVTCVAFSPLVDANGNSKWDPGEENAVRAVTSSRDNTVKLWDTRLTETERATNNPDKLPPATEILTLTKHLRTVTSVSFSRDGKRILSASRDGQAIVWQSVDWRVSPADERAN